MADQDDNEGQDLSPLIAELEGKSVQEILEEGKKALFIDLVVRVRANCASHQEKAILRNILKDAGMLVIGISPELASEAERTPAQSLDLPEFGTPDYLQ
jgi:hypothetical protein